MSLAKLFVVLLMCQPGHALFSDAVPPWSCIQTDPVLLSTCLNPSLNPLSLVHENSGLWIGDGFSGAVRGFFSSANDRSVAVKTFAEPLDDESEEDYVSVIRREYSIGKHLNHPNIVTTYDLYTDGMNWHQIMEYYPIRLQELVNSRKMSQDQVDCTFKGIVDGVEYMHNNSIAHLDLKLSNIMLDSNGSPKIIDFGSAVVFGRQNRTVKGIRGALPYTAPEVLENHAYDPSQVDMWALGIIFVCMTLRQCPWLQARPWDQSFRLFTTTNDSIMAANQTLPHHELPLPIHSGIERGPESLLHLLSQPARKIIGKLLYVNPESRATIEDLRSDEWFSGISHCQREDFSELLGYEVFHLDTSGSGTKKRLSFGYENLFNKSMQQQKL